MTKTTIYNIIDIDLCRSNIFNWLNHRDLFKVMSVKYLQKALDTVSLEDSIKCSCPYKLKNYWIYELEWALECEREEDRILDLMDEYEDLVQSYKFDFY